MGIDRPIVGFLTTSMRLDENASLNQLIHRRCEPEIAFRLGEVLDREVSLEETARLVDASAPAIEVIDSRYEDFRFLLPDVLADNASAAGFVVGDRQYHDLGVLPGAACRFFVDADLVQQGQGMAVLGHPLNSLVYLSQHLVERGDRLPAGSLVLSGSITEAVVLKKGSTHRVEVDGYPAVMLLA